MSLFVGGAMSALASNAIACCEQPTTSTQPSLLITLYQGVGSSYIYQDFGFLASAHPVAEGGATLSWKSGDTLDFWYSSGAGGGADEIDVSYWHSGSLASPAGMLDYQAKLAYYFLNSGGGKLFTPVDDALYGHFDIGKSFDLGKVSVGLHSKTELIEGLNNIPFFALERVGAPVDFKVTDHVSAEIEVAKAWNLTNNAYSPWELTPMVAWHISPQVMLVTKDKVAYAHHKMAHEVLFEIDWTVN